MSAQHPVLPKLEQQVQLEMLVTRQSPPTAGQRVVVAASSPTSSIDKELRKKLRNRQSALAARERKKARMLELESKVAELLEENGRMEDENQYLRACLETVVRQCRRSGIHLNHGGRELHLARFPIINFSATAAAGKAAGAEMVNGAGGQLTPPTRQQHAPKYVVIGERSATGDVAGVHNGGARSAAGRLSLTSRAAQPPDCSGQPRPSTAVLQRAYAIDIDKIAYSHTASLPHQNAGVADNVVRSDLDSSSSVRCGDDKVSAGADAVADIERRSGARRRRGSATIVTQQSLPSIDAVLSHQSVAKCVKLDDDKCFPRSTSGVWCADDDDRIGSRDRPLIASAAMDRDELLLDCSQPSRHDPPRFRPDCDELLDLCNGDVGRGEIASPPDAFSDVFFSDGGVGGGELFRSCDRNGSDSGLSMDDSLDWIADASIFDNL